MTKILLAICVMLLAVTAQGFDMPADGGDEPFSLVSHSRVWGGEPHTMLVLRRDASYLEKFAAHEFVRYTYRASTSRNLLEMTYGEVPSEWAGSAVIIDGQVTCGLCDGDTVEVRRARQGMMLVTHPGRGFFDTLTSKLQWGQSPHHI